MAIRALILDFDGLILDTETPEIEVWSRIYAEHGHEYPVENWSQIIGGWGNSNFDPAAALRELNPAGVDEEAVRGRHREESNERIWRAPVMAGVRELLEAARRLNLRCAIASSSERAWVEPHLRRLQLLPYFDFIITGDDVAKGRTKPHPDVYLKALATLQLKPDEVVVLEDSPNGVRAAHTAGLRVVGVPNPVTAVLNLEADLVLNSLAEMPLDDILKRVTSLSPATRVPKPLPGTAT